MASNNFRYSPTAATGNSNIILRPTEVNAGTADRNAVVTFTDGNSSVSVNVKQKYRPYFTMSSVFIPQNGGSITFTVNTEYDVAFRSVPEWVTITRGGTPVAEGTIIPAATASGSTFTITAGANTGQTRTVANTFNMGHYINGNIQYYVQYFNFAQAGSVEQKSMSIQPLSFDVGYSDTSVTVNLIVQNCTFGHFTTSPAGAFTMTATGPDANNRITLTFPANTLETPRNGVLSFYLYDSDGNAYTPKTVSVSQAAVPHKAISVSPTSIYANFNETSATIDLIVENCTFYGYTATTSGDFAITDTGPVNNKITLSFPVNNQYESRTGYITFNFKDTDGNIYQKTVTVEQEPTDRIDTDIQNLLFDYNETLGQAKTVQLYSGYAWMASLSSDYFGCTPYQGQMSTPVLVYPTRGNDSGEDRNVVITFDNGFSATTVTAKQLYEPRLTMPMRVFQASGGTLTFTVNSEHDYFFHDIPDWIGISRNGQIIRIRPDTRISSGTSVTYNMTAQENNSTDRRYATGMLMGYYLLDGTTGFTYFNVSQDGRSDYVTKNITLNVNIDGIGNDTYDIAMSITGYTNSSASASTTLNGVTSAGTVYIPARVCLTGTTQFQVSVTATRRGGMPLQYTNDITLTNGTDTIHRNGLVGTPIVFTTTYQNLDTMNVGITISTI